MPLLKFALGECQHLDSLQTVGIWDSPVPGYGVSGEALSWRVDIWIPGPEVPYPFMSQYLPKLVPPFKVLSREEDVLLTIAHELRHVEQFKLQPVKMRAAQASPSGVAWNEMELDAESFGQSVCLKWRYAQKIGRAA